MPRKEMNTCAEPDDEGVDATAEVSADEPQHHPERNRDERGEHADVEGDAGALDEPERHRAAEVVGAEPVRGGRRQIARGSVHAVVLRRHVADSGNAVLHLAEHGGGEVDGECREAEPDREPHTLPSAATSAALSSASV